MLRFYVQNVDFTFLIKFAKYDTLIVIAYLHYQFNFIYFNFAAFAIKYFLIIINVVYEEAGKIVEF